MTRSSSLASVRQHTHRDALGEAGHDRVGDGALKLGVDVAAARASAPAAKSR